MKGTRGPKGLRGVRGLRGKRGIKGTAGQRGPRVTKHDIMTAVARQFKAMHREFELAAVEAKTMSRQLDTQLVRMGQIQAQLDNIYKLVKDVLAHPMTDGHREVES